MRNVIATTSAATGQANFRPAEGHAGKRKIVALVEQNGSPRTSLPAGSYRAPGRIHPARPQRAADRPPRRQARGQLERAEAGLPPRRLPEAQRQRAAAPGRRRRPTVSCLPGDPARLRGDGGSDRPDQRQRARVHGASANRRRASQAACGRALEADRQLRLHDQGRLRSRQTGRRDRWPAPQRRPGGEQGLRKRRAPDPRHAPAFADTRTRAWRPGRSATEAPAAPMAREASG